MYKYKDVFSLRDEIGTCPNIEIEIDVTDKSPFFIRPYHVKEEDKALIDREMKWLCHLGVLKGFHPLFQSSDANQQETHKRQKSSDRLQTPKYGNSKEQFGISTT